MNPNNADRHWNEWMVFYCPDCMKGKDYTAVPSSCVKPFRYHMWLRHLSSPEHQDIVNRKYGGYYRMIRRTNMDEDRYVMTFASSNVLTERDLCQLCDEIAYYGVLTELVYLKVPAFCVFTLQASGRGRQGKGIDRALSIVQEFQEFRRKPVRIFQKALIKDEDWNRIFNKREVTHDLLSAHGHLKNKSDSKSQKECSSTQGKSEYQKDMQPEPTSSSVPFQAKGTCHENSRAARNNNAVKSYSNKEDEKENVIVGCSLEMSSRDNQTQPSRKGYRRGKSEKEKEQTASPEEASPQAQEVKVDDGINTGACENQNNVSVDRGGIHSARASSFSKSTKGRERRNKRTGPVDVSKLSKSSINVFANGIETRQKESVATSMAASSEKQDEVKTESPPPPNEESNEKQDEVETAATRLLIEESSEKRDEVVTEAPPPPNETSSEKQDEVVTEAPPPPNETSSEKQDEVVTEAPPPPKETSSEKQDEVVTEAPPPPNETNSEKQDEVVTEAHPPPNETSSEKQDQIEAEAHPPPIETSSEKKDEVHTSSEKQNEVETESPTPPNEEGNEKQDGVETESPTPPMEASGEQHDEVKAESPTPPIEACSERDEVKTEAPSNYPAAVSLCSSSSENFEFCKSNDTGALADVPQEIQPEMSAAVVQDEDTPDGAVSDVNMPSSSSDEAKRTVPTVRNSIIEDRDESSCGDGEEEPDYLQYALYWRRFKD